MNNKVIINEKDNVGVYLVETDGIPAEVTVWGDVLPAALHTMITPYSFETFYLADGAAEWKKVLLSEFDMEE